MAKFLKLIFNSQKWIPTEEELSKIHKIIGDYQFNRANEYCSKEDFKFKLVGNLLIRYSIKSLLNIDNFLIKLKNNSKGKPYLFSPKMDAIFVDFNVSHDGSYCVLNSTASREPVSIGIDVMELKNSSKALERFERISYKVFTDNEIKYVHSQKDKIKAYNKLWTLKESYVKALGDGIGFSLKRIELDCSGSTKVSVDGIENKNCLINETIYENYYISECLLTKSPNLCDTFNKIKFKEMTIDRMLNDFDTSEGKNRDT